MKTRSARHRVTDGVAAIDVNRKRSATGEMKGQQNGAGDGSVGNQPPAGYLQRLWAWLRRPQARGKTNHHIRRSRRLSHFATLKTMPELADVPSKCISSPAYRSGSAWEMEYAGKDMMTLFGNFCRQPVRWRRVSRSFYRADPESARAKSCRRVPSRGWAPWRAPPRHRAEWIRSSPRRGARPGSDRHVIRRLWLARGTVPSTPP